MITLSPCIRTLGVLHTNPDTGVEYGIDYFAWVLSEPLTDNRNRLHTFFVLEPTFLCCRGRRHSQNE